MTEARTPAEPSPDTPDGAAPNHPLRRALPTSEVTLRPSLVDALHQIAPKPERSRLRYPVALAMVAILIFMVATPSVREPLVAAGRRLLSLPGAPPAPEAPAASTPTASTAAAQPESASSVVAAPSFAIPGTATAAPSKKPGLRRGPPR